MYVFVCVGGGGGGGGGGNKTLVFEPQLPTFKAE